MPFCQYCFTYLSEGNLAAFYYHEEGCRLLQQQKKDQATAKATAKEKTRLEKIKTSMEKKQADRDALKKTISESRGQRTTERTRELELDKEKAKQMKRVREEEKMERPQRIVINNYTYNQTVVMGDQKIYLDYPKGEFTQKVIADAAIFDVKNIESVEQFQYLITYFQNKQSLFNFTPSQSLSFFADMTRAFRTRLQQEAPARTLVIEAMENYEKKCLDNKKKLGPTVEDVD